MLNTLSLFQKTEGGKVRKRKLIVNPLIARQEKSYTIRRRLGFVVSSECKIKYKI